MTLSEDFTNALNELEASNLLNGDKVLTFFLQVSAEEPDLVSFLRAHAEDVSLKEELARFVATKTFPADAAACLPFVFTLLYLFDQRRIPQDDFLTKTYPGRELDVSYGIFISALVAAIRSCLSVSDPENVETGIETTASEAVSDPFVLFEEAVKTLPNPLDAAVLFDLSDQVKAHAGEGAFEKAAEAFLALKKAAIAAKLPASSYDGIRLYLIDLGRRG